MNSNKLHPYKEISIDLNLYLIITYLMNPEIPENNSFYKKEFSSGTYF